MNWMREQDTEAIPGYTLVCPLGSGGFGEVWKCIAPGGIHKAIKFVYGNMNSLDGDAAKAEQEFKALERVKIVRHPFVLGMDRIEVVNGELLIVMELADKSLHDLHQEYVAGGRPGIPRELLMGFLADAAEGLDHLIDKHNLQHLDVKPKNLFLIADRVKVADFGLVKHLERQSGSGLMGGVTPVYAAPETFANKISKQTDQYSLALVYIELLTGQRPFTGKNIRQLALQHMTEAPDLRMLPESDRPVVARALAKAPEDRYPNCLAFVRALGGGLLRSDATNAGTTNAETPAPGPKLSRATVDLSPPKPGSTPLPRAFAPDYGVTTTSRIDVGVLRPVLLIGVGSFGRRAVQQVRCRLLDRVGDLAQVPSFRFLYIDTDPAAVKKATNGPDEIALDPEHVLQLPLQQPTTYRRKQIDQILEWLPREKLYAIPRSLTADGSRALSRLAFCDQYLKVATRLRHEIQLATHPESLKQSSDQTGLPVRSKVPGVYVFASAAGGSGGMLLDLGYCVRKALAKFNVPDAPVTTFLFAGAPEDPMAPAAELANIFATLTELNHYADPDVRFAAQYGGTEGPKAEGSGLPFSATYLLPMAQRNSEGFRDCVSHLSGYVAHELTTPLGAGLEDVRRKPVPPGRTPFRGFGTFGVWFPRGLLLRSAARQLMTEIFRTWASVPPYGMPPEVQQVTEGILGDSRLTTDSVQQFIVAEATRGSDGNPVEFCVRWARSLPETAEAVGRRADGTNWAIDVCDTAKDLIGFEPTTDGDSSYRRGRLSKALDVGVRAVCAAWENEFAALLRPLEELPGPRLTATESCLRTLTAALGAAALAADETGRRLAKDRLDAKQAVQTGLEALQAGSGGFTLFGSKAGRQLRAFADRVARFADLRVQEDLAAAAAAFYRKMGLKLDDRMRAVVAAREALAKLVDALAAPLLLAKNADSAHRPQTDLSDEAMQTTLHMANTVRVVLPNGDDRLDDAARDMLAGVTAEHIVTLQSVLNRLVVDPRGGLTELCTTAADLPRALAIPAVEQATAFLANLVPCQDVAEVELAAAEEKAGGLHKRIAGYVRLAAPLTPGPADDEKTFVLVPATDAGSQFGTEVKQVVPKAVLVPVQGQGTDLLFCREQGSLRQVDLMKLIDPCFEAYSAFAEVPEHSPHSRFDVPEWMPLVAR